MDTVLVPDDGPRHRDIKCEGHLIHVDNVVRCNIVCRNLLFDKSLKCLKFLDKVIWQFLGDRCPDSERQILSLHETKAPGWSTLKFLNAKFFGRRLGFETNLNGAHSTACSSLFQNPILNFVFELSPSWLLTSVGLLSLLCRAERIFLLAPVPYQLFTDIKLPVCSSIAIFFGILDDL